MLVLTIAVNTTEDMAYCIKESITNHLESFGDTKVVRIREIKPEQLSFEKVMERETIYE